MQIIASYLSNFEFTMFFASMLSHNNLQINYFKLIPVIFISKSASINKPNKHHQNNNNMRGHKMNPQV